VYAVAVAVTFRRVLGGRRLPWTVEGGVLVRYVAARVLVDRAVTVLVEEAATRCLCSTRMRWSVKLAIAISHEPRFAHMVAGARYRTVIKATKGRHGAVSTAITYPRR